MLKPLASTWVLSCALCVGINSYAANPTDPVAVVNNKTLTEDDYATYLQALVQQSTNNATPDAQTVIDGLISRELIIQDGLNKRLDQDPEFVKKMAAERNNLLGWLAARRYLDQHPLDDAAVKAEYDKRIAGVKMPKEYKVRHILVETEEAAKNIVAELDKGKLFADVAKAQSKDSATAENGGALEDWVRQQEVAFGDALLTIEKGKYTKVPVKSDFGWHVIQVDDVREGVLPSFESVKDRLRAAMQPQQIQDYIAELRKAAKIEILKKVEPAKAPAAEVKPATPAAKGGESPKPVEVPKPTEAPTPVESPKPVDVPEPAAVPKPAEIPKPVEPPKPVAPSTNP